MAVIEKLIKTLIKTVLYLLRIFRLQYLELDLNRYLSMGSVLLYKDVIVMQVRMGSSRAD